MVYQVPQNFNDDVTYNFMCQKCQTLCVSNEMKIHWNGLVVCSRCWLPYPRALLPMPAYSDPEPWPVVLSSDAQTSTITFVAGTTPLTAETAQKLW